MIKALDRKRFSHYVICALNSFRISCFEFRAWLLLPLISGLVGCSEGKSMVTGTVTMDGEPVASGAITFTKTEGELVREGAVIQDGNFRASVPPGIGHRACPTRTGMVGH